MTHSINYAPVKAPPTQRPDPETQLAHIAEISRNARTTWFALLGVLAFVGVTLLAHRDADFFTRAASTKLPLVNISVPVQAFFYTAPILVAAIYAYMHIYLVALWDALAEMPARVGSQALSDRVFPWLLSFAALRHRQRTRDDGCAEPRAMGWLTETVSILLGWVFGLTVMAMLWFRSMPAHDLGMTSLVAICLFISFYSGASSYLNMRARMRGATREEAVRWRKERTLASILLALATFFLTYETTLGGLLPHNDDRLPPLLIRADLEEAELTPRPADWKPFELWLRDLRREREIGEPEEEPLMPSEEEIRRWRLRVAALEFPSLRGRDLRGANARAAFLPGADLRSAKLEGVNLTKANISGSTLENAIMAGSFFFESELQGAILTGSKISFSSFIQADMRGAMLNGTEIRGSDFLNTELQNVVFWGADISGSSFFQAKMQGTNLFHASLLGVDLFRSIIRDAKCEGTKFLGVATHEAEIECEGLQEIEEEFMFLTGNSKTSVPVGIIIDSCLDKDGVPVLTWEQIELAAHEVPAIGGDSDIFPRFPQRLFC